MTIHPFSKLNDYVSKFCGDTPPDFQKVDIQMMQILFLKMILVSITTQLFDIEVILYL